jgi:hypothetical protein
MKKNFTNFTVESSSKEDLDEFLYLLQVIKSLSVVGANRSFTVNVDGDGSADFDFKLEGKSIPIREDFDPENIEDIYLGE